MVLFSRVLVHASYGLENIMFVTGCQLFFLIFSLPEAEILGKLLKTNLNKVKYLIIYKSFLTNRPKRKIKFLLTIVYPCDILFYTKSVHGNAKEKQNARRCMGLKTIDCKGIFF